MSTLDSRVRPEIPGGRITHFAFMDEYLRSE